jgi:hypothetical protein
MFVLIKPRDAWIESEPFMRECIEAGMYSTHCRDLDPITEG